MNKRFSRGYTLIELALGLVVIGVITVVVLRFGFSASQRIAQVEAPQTLIAADQALVGFVASMHRLPCPDTLGDGREHCSGAAIGRLPVVTLGLARADLLNVRYGVFRSAANSDSADLAVASDRFYPLLAMVPAAAGIGPSALPMPLGNINGIDFCHALRLSGALPRGAGSISDALNIRAPGATPGNSTILKNVAYALSLPGVGSDPTANLNTLDNSFAAPGQPAGVGYQDSVLAVDFGQLFERLSCGGILASAGHAHPNAASAAAIMRGAMLDYKVQLDLEAEIAAVGVLSAGAGVAAATGGVLSAAADMAAAISLTTLSYGTMGWTIGFCTFAIVSNAAALVSAGLALGSAETSRGAADARVAAFSATGGLLDNSSTLATTTRANAEAADAAGVY